MFGLENSTWISPGLINLLLPTLKIPAPTEESSSTLPAFTTYPKLSKSVATVPLSLSTAGIIPDANILLNFGFAWLGL